MIGIIRDSMGVDLGNVQLEVQELEARLRQAELGPDPEFFEEMLDDKAVLVTEDGLPFLAKAKIVEAHRPGNGPKLTRVEMSNMEITEQENAAVVTCRGTYEHRGGTVTLKFMRVWLRKKSGWKIVAGSVSK
jgi:hypothetical protein